jgi:5-methylcytosine-specific restriction endonuclease McrA
MSTRNTTLRDKHRAIIARHRPPCHICGQPIDYTLPHDDPDSYVVDHLTPLDRGGTDTLDNKGAAHRRCNRAKSNKPHAPIVRRSSTLA